MKTLLDQAEERIAPAAATTKVRQREVIEAMREDVELPHYEQAKI